MLAVADARPLQLVRIHGALLALGWADQRRLGVVAPWRRGPHRLTYRQIEHLFMRVVASMDPSPVPSFAGAAADGAPNAWPRQARRRGAGRRGAPARGFADALVEASVPEEWKAATTSWSVDWTDHAAWATPVGKHEVGMSADPDAGWGHRKSHAPGDKDQLFFGWYAQLVVMAPEESGPPVPELVRRVTLDTPSLDPVAVMAGVLRAMAASGVAVGDVLADSGYAHRTAERWATPLRQIGARLVQDLHPHDRGPKGVHEGAVLSNGSLYCPETPPPLLALGPTPRGADASRARRARPRGPTSSPAGGSVRSARRTPTATTARAAPPRSGRRAARSCRRR